MTDNIDNKNDAVVSKYFDLVQNELKGLISKDKDIKSDEIERFNNEIFNQPIEIQDKIREYIDNATEKNLDIKKVAKTLYDKFKLQIKNNLYNQDDKQDVPNQLMGERKHIMTFEKFFDINNFNINEKFSDRKPGKEGLLNSKSISKEMKDKILPYISNISYYYNKKVLDLTIPKIEGKSFNGVSLGADKNGFYVYTHRCRSHSYESPEKIPNSKIKFVESTG
ncbi:hypothetical protein M0Q97_00970 [Candidatus Dojkabacteria bacterium]|jgi:hypothetical protein|nr:hypothetical protein [Candidatus Dojkabacteria bacterium]